MALRAIELHRTRVRTPIELGRALASYAADPSEYEPDGLKKHVKPETAAQLDALALRLEALPEWSAAAAEAALRESAEQLGVSAGKLIHPTRLALTGVTVGAPLFDVVELLGRGDEPEAAEAVPGADPEGVCPVCIGARRGPRVAATEGVPRACSSRADGAPTSC